MVCATLALYILAGAVGILSLPFSNATTLKNRTAQNGRVTTSVIATPMGNVAWLVPIQIANQTFDVLLDTGSADL